MTTTTQRRRGFTLVEILVAMVLTIFILTIMAEAFSAGSDMFRGLKAVGDLNQSLRTATNIMGSDLAADHFEGKRRLSDLKFWTAPYNGPPLQGYFYLEQNPNVPPVAEGNDLDGLPIRRCAGHKMAFTVKARGNSPQSFYSALVPQLTIAGKAQNPVLTFTSSLGSPDGRYQLGGTFSSQWIEVSYFLVPLADGFTAQGTPLYALYRQQRLVLTDNAGINWTAGITGNPLIQGIPYISSPTTPSWLAVYGSKFSVQKNPATAGLPLPLQTLYFNNPADLTIPERRTSAVFQSGTTANRIVGGAANFVPAAFSPIVDTSGNLTGEDLLLTDVLSFDIQPLMSNSTADFADLPSPFYFDTWSSRRDDVYNYMNTSATVAAGTPIPNNTYTIIGLKITIRVYDEGSRVTRQVTLIQDM